MEPKDSDQNKPRFFKFTWSPKDVNSTPFDDPEFQEFISQMINEMNGTELTPMSWDTDNTDDFSISPSEAVLRELSELDVIDTMVSGENHPMALRMIMDAFRTCN